MNLVKHRAHREERIAPTPQTVAHLKPIAAEDLRRGRHNSLDLERACDEIALVYEAITEPALVGNMDRDGSGSGMASDPLSRMSAQEDRLWRERYRPWAHEMAKHKIRAMRWPNPTQLQLTLDLVALNLSPMEIALNRGVGPNAVKAMVIDALEAYVRLVR